MGASISEQNDSRNGSTAYLWTKRLLHSMQDSQYGSHLSSYLVKEVQFFVGKGRLFLSKGKDKAHISYSEHVQCLSIQQNEGDIPATF